MAEYRINYTQSNFTGGIIAAELYGRNDFNKVKTGLKKCTNWTIREAGGLEFRRGTRYVNVVPSEAGNKFKTASISDILIVFGENNIFYLDENNEWQTIAYPAIPNLDTLMFEELKQRLYFYDGTINLSEIRLDVNGVPYAQYSQFEKELTGATIVATKVVPGTAPSPRVDVDYQYAVALLSESAATETIALKSNVLSGVNAELSGDEYVNVKATIPQTILADYAGGKVLFFKRYQGQFYYLNSIDIDSPDTGTTNEFTYSDKGEYSVDLSKTMKEKPVYLTSEGYMPYVNSVADYGQRLFATLSLGLSESGINIMFSETGNTDSFAYSTLRNDDEAGYLEAPISHYDSWGRVISGLDLLFATSYTIQRITGYGDMQIEPVVFDGFSKNVQPVRTRRSLIYTNTNNRNVYDLAYNEYGQYDNVDLTLLIKYIFEQKTIKRLEIKDYPVKTIYVLCTDGDLYCLTYIKEQNIYAWYKIEHYGKVHDIHVINLDVEDEIYVVTKDNGNYIVELAYHRTDNIYMDCVVRVPRASIVDGVISGLPACFEGKRVRVFDLGNNLYYGDYDIAHPQTAEEGGNIVQIDDVEFNGYKVVNGSIVLGTDVDIEGNVLVGLPYYAVMETIPLEFQDSNGNSTIGRKKTISDAYLRYGDSRGLTYKTLGREYDCGICKKDIVDNAEFLERGQVRLNTESEYKWDSTIKLLQRQPYPARIESITLGLNFNDKS